MTIPTIRTRPKLPPLTRLTLAALLGSIIAFSAEFLLIGSLDREIAIVVVCLLSAWALIATGWRWTPVIGALLIGAIQANNPFLVYNLSQLENVGFFAATAVNVACSLVVIAGGIGATVQNYRGVSRSPGWLGYALIGLAGMVVGAIGAAGSVAARPMEAAGASSDRPATVAMQPNDFDRSAVTIGQGETVSLRNDSPVPHVIANGRWDGGVATPHREATAPLVDQVRVSRMGETVEIGPFSAVGTYSYYCPLHPGMNLTVTTQ